MAKTSVYQATGFFLLSQLEASGLRYYPAAVVDIKKGDALHDNTAGKATNATTAFANTFLGIAATDCDNTPEASLEVGVIPPLNQYQFIVPVEQNAVITRTIVGTIIDLQSVNTVDISDAVTTGPGFFVDDFDAGTTAVDANTYGYAIGHFVNIASVS